MRILQLITRSESGGGQSVVAVLANELALRGHEVLVASGPEGGGEAWARLNPGIEVEEVHGLVRRISPKNDIRALSALSALYGRWKPDIVHLHTSKAAALGRLANGIASERIVYTMHGYDQLAASNRKFLFIDKVLKKRCGVIVSVSEQDQEAMHFDGYESVLIENGADDLYRSQPPVTTTSVAIKAIRNRGLPVAIMIARRAAPKRPDLVRAAAKTLADELSIVWIGGDPEPGDPENFLALGCVSEAGRYIALADFLVLPSEHEGMPMSVLEAFSAGKPVVASAVGAIPNLFGCQTPERWNCGIAVKNTVEGFVRAMSSLASNVKKRDIMGRLARDKWTRMYSGALMAQRYEELYRQILARDPRSSKSIRTE